MTGGIIVTLLLVSAIGLIGFIAGARYGAHKMRFRVLVLEEELERAVAGLAILLKLTDDDQ